MYFCTWDFYYCFNLWKPIEGFEINVCFSGLDAELVQC